MKLFRSFTPWLGYLILVIVVSNSFFGCTSNKIQSSSEQLASINIIDRNGFSETITSDERLKKFQNVDFLQSLPYQKVLRIYNRDEQGNIPSYITSYYANGQPKQYLEVVNGRAFGTYQEWHANGKLKIEANVIGGVADIHSGIESSWLFDGLNLAWDEEGNLSAEISYEKGVLEGLTTHYHANGNVWKKIPYHKNNLHGTMEIYLNHGILLQTTEYTNGLKHGPSVRYWNQNQIAANEQYVNGKLIKGDYFDKEGEKIGGITNGIGFRVAFGKDVISELQEYRNGVMEGEVRLMARNGAISRIYHVRNNFKHGEEINFYDAINEKRPKLSIMWIENKIQGPVKTWYPNGTMESQREMSNNAKNGLAMAWYRDGSIMLMEEYEKDRLTKGEYFRKGETTPISRVIQGKGIASIFDGDGNFQFKVNYQNGIPMVQE